MRAFYYPQLPSSASELLLEDEIFQHLKVVRLRIGEELLLLDGRGRSSIARLIALEKKFARVQSQAAIFSEAPAHFDIALGLVKKDAFDLCLKMAVELGAQKIIPLETRFSQRYELNLERSERLMIQALEQSNSRWLPQLSTPMGFESLDFEKYPQIVVMGMGSGGEPAQLPPLRSPVLGLVGPEGGFDQEEEQRLMGLPNAHGVHLPCPILRTPTALAALAGVIFTKQ